MEGMELRNLIYSELLKLKGSRMKLISIIAVLSTPAMIFIEALQSHYEHPERVVKLEDMYDNSLLYVMILTNMMIYVAITAYLFSREYTEKTLKNILPIPVSRNKFVLGKFLILFLWIIELTLITWIAMSVLASLYHFLFGISEFYGYVFVSWLIKYLLSGVLMFLTITPFAYIAEKTKGIVAPVIAGSVIVMGSAALSNQDLGALYPWTGAYFLIKGRIESTGFSPILTGIIIAVLIAVGFIMTFNFFNKEDLE